MNEQPPEMDISIQIAGVPLARSGGEGPGIVFAETTIECQAFARPGQATIVVHDPGNELDVELGSEVVVEVGGERVFGGILMTKDFSNFLPAGSPQGNSTRVTFYAVDFNILLDKSICWNRAHPREPLKTYEPGTTDVAIIEDFFENYITTTIEQGHMQTVGTPIPKGDPTEYAQAMGYTGNGYIVGPGATMRAMLEEIANNIAKGDGSDLGSAIGYSDAVTWYVDSYRKLYWGPMESNMAPFSIDLTSGIAREISVTHDISQLKNDVLCWALERAPLKFKRIWSEGSVGKYGRFQFAEHLSNSFSQEVVTAHARAVANQNLNPTRSARFTTFTPGLYPGMIVNILGEDMPLRSMRISFPNPTTARFDCEAIIETNAPWRYWMSMARAERKGMEQPTFSSVDISAMTLEERAEFVPVAGLHMIETAPEMLSDSQYRTFAPFIRGSLEMRVKGFTLRYNKDFTDFNSWDGEIVVLEPLGNVQDIEVRYKALGPRTSS